MLVIVQSKGNLTKTILLMPEYSKWQKDVWLWKVRMNINMEFPVLTVILNNFTAFLMSFSIEVTLKFLYSLKSFKSHVFLKKLQFLYNLLDFIFIVYTIRDIPITPLLPTHPSLCSSFPLTITTLLFVHGLCIYYLDNSFTFFHP